MLTINAGTKNEVTLRVVLESEECGREYFDGHDSIDDMLAAVRRLAESSADCAADDGVERVVGIAVVPKSEYGNESGYGFDLD
ncbi:MAG: hypothetical protein IH899_21825 [Planctomycetes bacterium]|nr:hypothetical protein [Planctomycetota bacterium]